MRAPHDLQHINSICSETPLNQDIQYFFNFISNLPQIKFANKRKLYHKLFVGERIIDALWHLPTQIINRIYLENLDKSHLKSTITVPLNITKHLAITYSAGKQKNRSPYRIIAQDDNNITIELLFFNAAINYLQKVAPTHSKVIVSGVLEEGYENQLQMIHPTYIGPLSNRQAWTGVMPVYPLTAGLIQASVSNIIKSLLNKCPDVTEWHSQDLLEKRNWPSFKQALSLCHKPQTPQDLTLDNLARQRLIMDEFLSYHLSQLVSKQINANTQKIASNFLQKTLLQELPFILTNGQIQAIEEIQQDMASPKQMLRLLQGDVGSGKTIVALLAALYAVAAGYQVAFLVPTEILAQQHLTNIQKYLVNLPVNTVMLTGKEQGKIRKKILADCADGSINILVGTHAILQQWVNFAKLGLVIIDEQQRFGVEQRTLLSSKGDNPDILSMTATPIPRTLQLANYGEMDISIIKEKPPGRKPITTKLINFNRINEVTDFLARVLEKNQQVYWVCPLIEESESSDLTAVEKRYKILQQKFGEKVGILHGKMPIASKQNVINSFQNGTVKILVATTVIEVGVDVPQSTVMIVEHAERFGLSQLHQLRGRVGRNDVSSYCILIYYDPLSPIAKKRLETMRNTDDGFKIAETDLKLRGSGDVLGTKQSGMPKFRLADFSTENQNNFNITNQLFEIAYQEAIEILNNLSKLPSAQINALQNLLQLFEHENSVIYKKSG